jgi:hypothetical protein
MQHLRRVDFIKKRVSLAHSSGDSRAWHRHSLSSGEALMAMAGQCMRKKESNKSRE